MIEVIREFIFIDEKQAIPNISENFYYSIKFSSRSLKAISELYS